MKAVADMSLEELKAEAKKTEDYLMMLTFYIYLREGEKREDGFKG